MEHVTDCCRYIENSVHRREYQYRHTRVSLDFKAGMLVVVVLPQPPLKGLIDGGKLDSLPGPNGMSELVPDAAQLDEGENTADKDRQDRDYER